NTFLLLACLALLAERQPAEIRGEELPVKSLPAGPIGGRAPRWLDLLSFAALLCTAATGAIAALGDTLFPATTLAEGLAQDLSSTAHFLIQLRVFHPLVAIATGILWIHLAQRVRAAAPDGSRARRWATWMLGLVVTQFAIGLATLALLAPVPLQLLHLLCADLVWIAGVLLVDARMRHTS
ncbi:MAG: COX15/CtaA family protein, partial [Thermoanaerobaculia bacterium]